MSFCAVNMQKYNAGALGGLQSHNQREHESRKNREIDPEKQHLNYDTVNDDDINLHQRVKERISELHLKRAVRKDAVVICSFIVSSDQEFFRRLGYLEHVRRENRKEMVAIGLREPSDFDECDPSYQAECIAAAAKPFFRDATKFFQRRFGAENVVYGNVHHDEPGAGHIHLGVVPITEDGRLSAKALFTPETLRQLQTDFAAEVGAKYDLERGREGSDAKHLDELTFKLKQREAALEGATEALEEKHQELQKASQELQEAREGLEAVKGEAEGLRAAQTALRADCADLRQAYERAYQIATRQVPKESLEAQLAKIREEKEKDARLSLLDKFLAWPPGRAVWEQFQQLQQLLQRERREKKRQEKKDDSPVL